MRKIAMSLVILTLALAGGGALTLALDRAVREAGQPGRFTRVAQVPARPVAIVLGARVLPGGEPSLALADRLHAALELHRAGTVQRILVSGDHHGRDYDEPNAMRRWLLRQGVPSEAIFMDHAGLRTLDTMQRASRVFGVRGAVVCTQAFHLPRSLFLARAAGIDAVGLAADRRVYARRRFDAVRETGARVKAWLDVRVLGTQARFLGPAIPIDGDARLTHDMWTQRDDRAEQAREPGPGDGDADR